MMHTDLQNHLKTCGWSAERRVNIIKWYQPLLDAGFTILKKAELILEEFGELTISPVIDEKFNMYMPTKIYFDPLRAIGEDDRICEWQNRLNCKLTPIAELDDLVIILISETGAIYGIADDLLWFIGDTFDEALDNLVYARKKLVEVGSLRD